MPASIFTIAMVNPKGGAGKTTAAMAIAESFTTRYNLKVAVIDCDGLQHIKKWRDVRDNTGEDAFKGPYDVVHAPNQEGAVLDAIDALDQSPTKYEIYILDLQGSQNLATNEGISRAHLAIIPMAASQMDMTGSQQAITLINYCRRSYQREIPYKFMFSRTNAAFVEKEHRFIMEYMDNEKLPYFKASLCKRSSFNDALREYRTLKELYDYAAYYAEHAETAAQRKDHQKAQERAAKAIINVDAVAQEVLLELKKISGYASSGTGDST